MANGIDVLTSIPVYLV